MSNDKSDLAPPPQAPVSLQGQRCLLRPFRRGDEEAIVRHANDRAVWRGLYDIFPHPYTLQDAENWVQACEQQADGQLQFAIVVDGDVRGGIGIGPPAGFNRDCLEVGYWLGQDYWGRGIATEALRLVCDHAFSTLGANRIEARLYGFNPASGRVLEKCGFMLEGRLRRRMVKDGEHADQLIYGLLPEDPCPSA